ncbi:unnamed protein product [Phaeothamnion confervicola]
MKVTSYEPEVVAQLAERMRHYAADLLFDARDYSSHVAPAGRGVHLRGIEIDDLRLAVSERQQTLRACVPDRDTLVALAARVNQRSLPPIPDDFGVRLPRRGAQLTALPMELAPGTDIVPDPDDGEGEDEKAGADGAGAPTAMDVVHEVGSTGAAAAATAAATVARGGPPGGIRRAVKHLDIRLMPRPG